MAWNCSVIWTLDLLLSLFLCADDQSPLSEQTRTSSSLSRTSTRANWRNKGGLGNLCAQHPRIFKTSITPDQNFLYSQWTNESKRRAKCWVAQHDKLQQNYRFRVGPTHRRPILMTRSQMFICNTIQDQWDTDKNIWGHFPVGEISPNPLSYIFKNILVRNFRWRTWLKLVAC